MEKGYIQVYTGNGKGKTTASMGLATRALGDGRKVFFGQFMKGHKDSAYNIFENIDAITLHLFGGKAFVGNNPKESDKIMAQEGIKLSIEELKSGKYDVFILDEINVALMIELISKEQFDELIKSKPEHTELILTGRYAPNYVIEVADLVTDMREIKHYYNDGVIARKGIEF